MKRQLYRYGVIDTTIEIVDFYTEQNDTINDPSFIKKDDHELVVKEFFEMRELFLETKLKVSELNTKLTALKNVSGLKNADTLTSLASSSKPGLEKSTLGINKGTKTDTLKKKEKFINTKESSVESSKDLVSDNDQSAVLTNQERKSLSLSLEYTQDELEHIEREWSSHNQSAKKVWKLARKYSGTAFKREDFEIYDYIDIDVEGPDPSNYDAYRARICAMIETAAAKASIPNNILMNFKAQGILRNYGTRLEAIVDYLDNFYDADIRFIATLIEIALHMSCRNALYTDPKCLALIKYASSFLKLPVTDDKFLNKLIYFVEYLFKILQNKMPLRAYSEEDCSIPGDEKKRTKSADASSHPLTATNLIIADCRCFDNRLLDKNKTYKHANSFRYSYLSYLKILSETKNVNQKFVEFEAFNQGIKKCLKSFNFYHLMLNKTFTLMKPPVSSAHERDHDERVDKKMSVEFAMFMRMMNRLKCAALILFIKRLQKDYDDLDVMVELLSKNPFGPNLSRHFGSYNKLNDKIQAVNRKTIEMSRAKEFYKDLSRNPRYKLSATFESTRKNMATSVKNVYPRSFFVAECEEKIEKLKVPKKIYGTKTFGVYMRKFLQYYEKYS